RFDTKMMSRRRLLLPISIAALVWLNPGGSASAGEAIHRYGLSISGPTPWPDGCPGIAKTDSSGKNAVGTEASVSLAVNPLNRDNLVAVWVQDYGAGVVGAYSFDGGMNWTKVILPGLTTCYGGPYTNAQDTAVSFGADGVAYASHATNTGAGNVVVSV